MPKTNKLWGVVPIQLVLISLVLIGSAYIGRTIGSANNTNIQIPLLGLILLAGVVMLVSGERGIQVGFLLWILMFVIGYRTFQVSANYRLHPLVVVMLLLFALLFVRETIFSHKPLSIPIPPITKLFALFWIWGILVGIIRGLPIDAVLLHFTNFAILIPIFTLTYYIFQKNQNYWHWTIITFFGVGTFIAILGLIEYFFPNIQSLFPEFIRGNTVTYAFTSQGFFRRAQFIFYGHPVASFICALALPLALPIIQWYQAQKFVVLLTMAASASLTIAVYIGGFRSLWVAVALLFLVLALLQRNVIVIAFVGLLILLVYLYAPEEGLSRFQSVPAVFEGDFQDRSSLTRYGQAQAALLAAFRNPLGLGWSASGWVHSDFIQLAADTGIVSALVFMIWYLWTLFRISLKYLSSPELLTLGLIGSFFIAGTLFLTQPIYVLPQLVVPVWLIWALVSFKLREPEISEGETVAQI